MGRGKVGKWDWGFGVWCLEMWWIVVGVGFRGLVGGCLLEYILLNLALFLNQCPH